MRGTRVRQHDGKRHDPARATAVDQGRVLRHERAALVVGPDEVTPERFCKRIQAVAAEAVPARDHASQTRSLRRLQHEGAWIERRGGLPACRGYCEASNQA